MATRLVACLAVIAGASSSVAAPSSDPAQHELRFKIRLHDGYAAAGAFVDIDDCGLSAQFREPPPSPAQETDPVVLHACKLRTKADASGEVVIPYSGRRRAVLATITHPRGIGQVVQTPLRGDTAIKVRLRRGSTPELTIACGKSPCDPMTVGLTVIKGRTLVYAHAVPDPDGVVRLVGVPEGKTHINVVHGRWFAAVDWDRRRPLAIYFPVDAPTYAVTAKAIGIAGSTGAIRGSAKCQFDGRPGVEYRPPFPVHAALADGAQLTFSELRGACTLTVTQHAQSFVKPSAWIVVSGAGNVELQIQIE